MAETPPGPTGVPLVGSGHQYAKDPFRFLTGIESAYGDVAQFRLGPMDTWAVFNPAAIERVLVSRSDAFRKPDFRGDAIDTLLGDGLLMSDGAHWERQRAIANPAFSMERLAGLADRITDHAATRIGSWTPGETVDVERMMVRTTLDIVLDVILGVELPEQRVRFIETQLEPLGRRFQPNPLRFAAPDWIPFPDDAEFDRAVDNLDDVVDEIVQMRANSTDGDSDFLTRLLRASDRGDLSADQLRDEIVTVLLAGHDTTALALTYTWILLSEHPRVERRVHEEVDAVLSGDEPTMAHVNEFEYLEWVISEAMRLYPPVYTIFRLATERVELAGYSVPPGTTVMLPQWAVHRSDRYYDDPGRFDPERWRPERAGDRQRFAYFPFGGGPRHCIGKHLAMLEAQLIIALVASQYRLDFCGETPLELLPSLTVHPREEIRMRVDERSKNA